MTGRPRPRGIPPSRGGTAFGDEFTISELRTMRTSMLEREAGRGPLASMFSGILTDKDKTLENIDTAIAMKNRAGRRGETVELPVKRRLRNVFGRTRGPEFESLTERVPSEEDGPQVSALKRRVIPERDLVEPLLKRVGTSDVFAQRFTAAELRQQDEARDERVRQGKVDALGEARGMLRGDTPFPAELSRDPIDQEEFLLDVGRSLLTGEPAETPQGTAVSLAAENIPVLEQLVGIRDIGLGVQAGLKGNKAEGFIRGAAGLAAMIPLFPSLSPLLKLPSSPRSIAPGRFSASRRLGVDPSAVPTVRHITTEVSQTLDGLSPVTISTERGIASGLRNLEYGDAIDYAKRGGHLRRGSGGTIVGAPAGVVDDVSLTAMRDEFDMHMARGWTGGTWYRRAREGHANIVGPNQIRRNQLGTNEAVFSAGADPNINLGFTVRAQGQFAAGDPIRAGRFPTNQSDKVERVLRGGAGPEDVLAMKTQPFGHSITPDEAREVLPYGTNDIWHARALGYKNPDGSMFDRGLSQQQHKFIDGETLLAAERANAVKLGGRADWTPEEVQAAVWISKKGEALTGPGSSLGSNAAASNLTEGLIQASKEFTDATPRFRSFATNEVIPGAGTDLFENLDELIENPLLKEQFAADPLSSSVDEAGRDLLFDEARLFNEPPVLSEGVYKNSLGDVEFNPATTVPVLNSRDADKLLGKVVSSPDASVMDKVQAMRTYIDAQEAGAWHAIPTVAQGAKPGATNALRVAGGEAHLLPDLIEAIKPYGLEAIHTGDGFSLVPGFSTSIPPAVGADLLRAMDGELGTAIRETLGDVPIERAVFDAERTGGYVSFVKEWKEGEGAVTRKLFELLDESPEFVGVTQRLEEGAAVPRLAARRLQRDDNWAQALGGVREDVQAARELLAEGGLKALRKALADGTIALPVLAGAFGIKHLTGESDGTEPF